MIIRDSSLFILPSKQELAEMLENGNLKLNKKNMIFGENKNIFEGYGYLILDQIKNNKYDLNEYIVIKKNLMGLSDIDLCIYNDEIMELLKLDNNTLLSIANRVNDKTDILDKSESVHVSDISKIIKFVILDLKREINSVLNKAFNLSEGNMRKSKELMDFIQNEKLNTIIESLRDNYFNKYKDFINEIPEFNTLFQAMDNNFLIQFNDKYRAIASSINYSIERSEKSAIYDYNSNKKLKFKDGIML